VSGAQAAQLGQAVAVAAATPWAARAAAWIAARTAGEPFTADDVTDAVGLPSGGIKQNGNGAVGAVFAQARRAGLIDPIGWVESTRPTSHARPVRLWQRTGTDGALW
jgi:hypothetical protein